MGRDEIERLVRDRLWMDGAGRRACYFRPAWESLGLTVAWCRGKGYLFTADDARAHARAKAAAQGRTYEGLALDAVAHGLLHTRWHEGQDLPAEYLDVFAEAAGRRGLPDNPTEIERYLDDRSEKDLMDDADQDWFAYRQDGVALERLVAWARRAGYRFTAAEARQHAEAKARAVGRSYTAAQIDRLAHGLLQSTFPVDEKLYPPVLDRLAGPPQRVESERSG